jgi:outer membrane immunogenic protein
MREQRMRQLGYAILGLSSLGLSSLGFVGAASAADLAVKAPPPVVQRPLFSWTGFYMGLNLGGAWSTGHATDNVTGSNFGGDNGGFIGGGQIGYNYQVGNWVWGIEWDMDGADLSRTSNAITTGSGTLQASGRTDWITTVGARVGWAVLGNSLIYVKGGGGWVENSATLMNLTTGGSASGSNTNGGWMAGVGWEWGFAPNWSAKFEYDFLGLNSWSPSNTVLVGGVADRLTLSRDIEMVKVGVNYRFNWGSYH